MPVIVLAATKGGVGKTTLSAVLAVEAARRGMRVALIDLDPQQSLARWHELRGVRGHSIEAIRLIEPGKHEETQAQVRRALKEGADWVIIDTPPALILRIEPAVSVADLVVVAVQPSPLDVEAIDPIAELATAHARDFVFVLNRTSPRSKLTQSAIEYLSAGGEVLDVEVGNRQAYAGAMIDGRTAPEAEPKGASVAEIASLWDAIETRVKKTVRLKARA